MGNLAVNPFIFDLDLAYAANAIRQPWEAVVNEGVEGVNDLLVVPKGGSAASPDAGGGARNNTVDTLIGWAWVLGDVAPNTDGIYRCWVDVTQNDAFTANSTGSTRNDSVILEVLDTPTYLARTRVVAGASGGGLATIPGNAIELARVALPNGFTTGGVITASMITDVRKHHKADTSSSVRRTAGSDLALPQNATTDILTATFTLAKAQPVKLGASVRFDNSVSTPGLAALALLIDGTLDPYGTIGPVEVGGQGADFDRATVTIPTHAVHLAAGAHTVKLQSDRGGAGTIVATGAITFNSRSYVPTWLYVEI